MAKASGIQITGLFEHHVLGYFTIIRGFARLQDLAEISTAYVMQADGNRGPVSGHQRPLNEDHAARIKQYLTMGDYPFLPEVILSVRTDFESVPDAKGEQVGIKSSGTDGIEIKPRGSGGLHQITIDRKALAQLKQDGRIRRIDGNHRLALADQLEEQKGARQFLAPFCLIILHGPKDPLDNYAESLVFHTINSTALPLEAEHALTLILNQRADLAMTPEKEFAYNPRLHLTRLLRDKINGLPGRTRERLGEKPLTVLSQAAQSMIDMKSDIALSLESLRRFAEDLFEAFTEMIPLVAERQPELCKASYFIELAARVWLTVDGTAPADRVRNAVAFLADLGAWVGTNGIVSLQERRSLADQLLQLYRVVRDRMPKRVFVARWYPTEARDEEFAKSRLEAIQAALEELQATRGYALQLKDMDSDKGGTIPIRREMYDAIASSDIVLIDLTGLRPNVCVEAGFAIKHIGTGRLIFIHHQYRPGETVPFDLSDYRYESFEDTGSLKRLLLPNLEAVMDAAKAGKI